MSSLRVALWEQLAFHQLCRGSFLMLTRTSRTSPPFVGIRSLPINPELLTPIRSDWLGRKEERPPRVQHSVLWPDVPWASSFPSSHWPLSLYICLCHGSVKSVSGDSLRAASWRYTQRQLLCILSAGVQGVLMFYGSHSWIAVGGTEMEGERERGGGMKKH